MSGEGYGGGVFNYVPNPDHAPSPDMCFTVRLSFSRHAVDAHVGRSMVVGFVSIVDKHNHHPPSDMGVHVTLSLSSFLDKRYTVFKVKGHDFDNKNGRFSHSFSLRLSIRASNNGTIRNGDQ